MAKPWEKYQQAAPAPADGPWAKYAETEADEGGTIHDDVPVQVFGEGDLDPTQGMTSVERQRAALGRNMVRLGSGVKQGATSAAEYFLRANPAIGNIGGAHDKVAQSLAGQHAAEAESRELDAPLMKHGDARATDVLATLATIFGPGAVLRGTTAGAAFLPRTIAGNVGQGMAIGAAQPSVSEGERAQNIAVGGGLGGAGAAVPRAIGATYRGVKGAVQGNTQAGAQRAAVQAIQREASDPVALMTATPSRVPGVRRSLFDETQDAGVARMETRARQVGNGWADVDSANNAARSAAIGQFAGDEATLAASIKARRTATEPLRKAAMLDRGVDVAPVKSRLAGMIEKSATRPTRLAALMDVDVALSKADDSVESLYGVRQYIDDLMQGKAGSDKGYAKAAKADLVQVKSALDQQIKAASPQFGNYLDEFIARSGDVNRQQVGQGLLKGGSGRIKDPNTGAYVLTPGLYGGQVKTLDRMAQRATGFKGTDAARVLGPQAMDTVNAVDDDLSRSAQRLIRGAGAGSHTNSQGELGKRLAARSVARVVPGLGVAMEYLEQAGAKRLQGALDLVLQNPEQYRAIAAKLSVPDQRLLQNALNRVGGSAGAMSPALAE